MTEEEAKTKRCCGPEGCGSMSVLIEHSHDEQRYCIGSACMAWRKKNEAIWPDDARFNKDRPDENVEISGYCGLAGKP